jgi:hypothetical protein
MLVPLAITLMAPSTSMYKALAVLAVPFPVLVQATDSGVAFLKAPCRYTPRFVRAVAAFVNALKLLPVASVPKPKFVRAPAAVPAPVPPLVSFRYWPASKSASNASKSAFIFVPHVSVDAPISGLVKFSTAVKVSAMVGSG